MDAYNELYIKFLERMKPVLNVDEWGLEIYDTKTHGFGMKATKPFRTNDIVCYYTGCLITSKFYDAESDRNDIRARRRVFAHVQGGIHIPPKISKKEYDIDARNCAMLTRDNLPFMEKHAWACGGLINAPSEGLTIASNYGRSPMKLTTPEGNVAINKSDNNVKRVCDLYNAQYTLLDDSIYEDIFGYAGVPMRAIKPIKAGDILTHLYEIVAGYNTEDVEVFRFDGLENILE